ncbi:hypothetical protein ABXN37_12575 [Piscinibacter sakaiensis]|uniref:hypothetical protein n=1 Tax=Piscinibacter sakaiensis TaxID=1547922 RepID=UPI00372A0F19
MLSSNCAYQCEKHIVDDVELHLGSKLPLSASVPALLAQRSDKTLKRWREALVISTENRERERKKIVKAGGTADAGHALRLTIERAWLQAVLTELSARAVAAKKAANAKREAARAAEAARDARLAALKKGQREKIARLRKEKYWGVPWDEFVKHLRKNEKMTLPEGF